MDNETLEKIEAWFLRRFGHITPGTPAYADALAIKGDLIATLSEPKPTTES